MSASLHHQDTIAACATAPGRGGVAIIRVSGPLTSSIAEAIVKTTLTPRLATHTSFYDEEGTVLDDGIALFFKNPHSFTGEDVLELQGHGGPVIVDLLLQRILALGARLARPGEFSERAFLNNKLDLAQAEAVADLIDATSAEAAKLAMKSLQGEFSNKIHALNEQLIHLRMYIEAAIDFTDEEIDFLSDDKIKTQTKVIIDALTTIQMQAKQGSLLREGITVVIAGQPNVGKSSLLNALSGKDLAIVTDIPGTTRDVLRDVITIDGMPLHIVDTAGIRKSDDVVELEGIRRAEKEIEKADIVLFLDCHPEPREGSAANEEIPRVARNDKANIIYVHNKIDLHNVMPAIKEDNQQTHVYVSAKTHAGLDLLKNKIKSIVGLTQQTEGLYLARRRHLDAIARAKTFVEQAFNQLATQKNGELAAEDLRLAHLALCEITGEFTTDDLLGRIFSSFCVGK
jgi:tRNA modification GTPase